MYHKWQSYDVYFLKYWARWTEFFVILDHLLPLYTASNPKTQNFDKLKETPGDIIILHNCAINYNHMIYGSLRYERDGQNFLSFGTVFCPFTLLTTQKIKILKNSNKQMVISSFYTSVPKIMIVCYIAP